MQARTKKACFQLARPGLFSANLRLFFHIWKYYKAFPENGTLVSSLHKSRFKKRTAGLSAYRACPGKEGKVRTTVSHILSQALAALNAQERGKDNLILFHVQSRKHQAESAKCGKHHQNRNNTVQEISSCFS